MLEQGAKVSLSVAHGHLDLKEFTFHLPSGWEEKQIKSSSVSLDGTSVDVSITVLGSAVRVQFKKALEIEMDEKLEIEIQH